MGIWSEENSLTGEQIKALRGKIGLSQREFAERLGVTHAHISKIESGKENPSTTLQMLIRYEFGVAFVGYTHATETKPKIAEHLHKMEEILVQGDLNEGTLYNMEHLLSSCLLLLNETKNSEQFQIQLLEALCCAIGEVAFFLSRTNATSHFTKYSELSFIKRELLRSFADTYNLLEEHLK